MVSIPASSGTLGRGPMLKGVPPATYGWCNEFGQDRYHTGGFAASRRLVTNADFLRFVRCGGYERPEFWTESGWAWLRAKGAKHPLFWVPRSLASLVEGEDPEEVSQQRMLGLSDPDRDYLYR